MTERERFNLAVDEAKQKKQQKLEAEKKERNKIIDREKQSQLFEQISKNVRCRKLKEQITVMADEGTEPLVMEFLHNIGINKMIDKIDDNTDIIISFEKRN